MVSGRTPEPQLQKFGKLVLLLEVGEYRICLDWLSGALVGVGGSDLLGYVRGRGAAPSAPIV